MLLYKVSADNIKHFLFCIKTWANANNSSNLAYANQIVRFYSFYAWIRYLNDSVPAGTYKCIKRWPWKGLQRCLVQPLTSQTQKLKFKVSKRLSQGYLLAGGQPRDSRPSAASFLSSMIFFIFYLYSSPSFFEEYIFKVLLNYSLRLWSSIFFFFFFYVKPRLLLAIRTHNRGHLSWANPCGTSGSGPALPNSDCKQPWTLSANKHCSGSEFHCEHVCIH